MNETGASVASLVAPIIDTIVKKLDTLIDAKIEEAYNRAYPLMVITVKPQNESDLNETLKQWTDSGNYNVVTEIQQLPDYHAMWQELKQRVALFESPGDPHGYLMSELMGRVEEVFEVEKEEAEREEG